MATVSSSSRSNAAGEKSDVAVVAERCPRNTRRPRRFSRALFTVSTPRIRTRTEKDSSSTMTTSAPLAPSAVACLSTSLASSR